jgi:hypothetical protein
MRSRALTRVSSQRTRTISPLKAGSAPVPNLSNNLPFPIQPEAADPAPVAIRPRDEQCRGADGVRRSCTPAEVGARLPFRRERGPAAPRPRGSRPLRHHQRGPCITRCARQRAFRPRWSSALRMFRGDQDIADPTYRPDFHACVGRGQEGAQAIDAGFKGIGRHLGG